MTEQHRATPGQWALIERMRHHGGHPEFSAILELLHRIEALEATAQPNHPAKSDILLVDREAEHRSMLSREEWSALLSGLGD